MRLRSCLPACAGLLALLAVRPAAASWPADPLANLRVHAESCNEQLYGCVSDGSGGVVLTGTSGGWVFAQQVGRGGSLRWGGGARLSSVAVAAYGWPRALADSVGGAFVVWSDAAGTHAQHVSGDAAMWWGLDGVLLGATGGATECAITSDAAGGAIVAWAPGYLLYAKRLADDGSPAWGEDPVTVSTEAGWTKRGLAAVPDGAGGAIVTWRGGVGGAPDYRAFAQRVSAEGEVLWAPEGVALGASSGQQWDPKSIPDGAGGAIVAWYEDAGAGHEIRAQRISATGALLWGPSGVTPCGAAGDRYGPVLVPDAAGGAIVAWYEQRGGDWNVYAQRLSPAGARLWPAAGVTVCGVFGTQQRAVVVPDGSGGAIVAWEDLRATELTRVDVFAQRLGPDGVARWAPDGVPVSRMPADQWDVVATGDGHGGAILAWEHGLAGLTCTQVYAQRLDGTGVLGDEIPVPTMVSFLGAEIDGGAAALAWWLAGHEGASAGIERAVAPGAWTRVGQAVVDGSGYVRYRDGSLPGAPRVGYRLALADGETLGEAWVDLPARGFALEFANPVAGRTAVLRFSLPRAAPASLRVADAAGRLVVAREVGGWGAGGHALDLGRLPPGLYLVTLRQGAEARVRRLVVLR